MALRLLFFGTPAFALASLDALLASHHQVVAIVTQPDRPRGRGHRVTAGPVKARAVDRGIPALQPARIQRDAFEPEIRAYDFDLAVVAAYGKILPQWLIDTPRLGMINVHASLLPRWRGAAPIHRAVLAGDAETGITIMRIVQALDAGPMLARHTTPIGPDETSADLEARLAALGADLLLAVVDRLAQGPVSETPQDETAATYAARLDRRDSPLSWNRPAFDLHNQIRGLQPWPLAASVLQNQRVIVLESRIATELATQAEAEPGEIVAVEPDALVVAARPGALRITRIQAEGRAPMSVRDFLNGHRISPGERFAPLALPA